MVRISVTAAFDGPARAIRCAVAIREQSRALGIDVRTGLHTGECERRGDDLAGIAVHIGARVAARAQAGEVLVTSTVRYLVAGSGIMFTDRGEQALKGVPAPWRLLAVDVGREVGPMTCPARGRENRAGLRFCEECDAALFALLCDLRR